MVDDRIDQLLDAYQYWWRCALFRAPTSNVRKYVMLAMRESRELGESLPDEARGDQS